jgi:PTH1 family peptidyl-tRNA hydrolase
MNNSGRALGRAVKYYKVPPDRVLVVYDEIDLPPGRVRLKFDGGHAGHNGMRSIIEHLGAKFWRIRIGVGHPGDRNRVGGHVLRRAAADEEQLILDGVRDALDALPVLLDEGADAAKQKLHTSKPNK